MDEPSAAKRPSVLTIDRAAFLLLRVKRAFKKKRQQRKDKNAAAAAAAAAEALGTCRRAPPPLLRSRTLPAIVVPGLSILHAQIDAKNDLTQSQMLCRGVSTHKVCGLRAQTPRISFTSKDEDAHERRKSASSRLGSSPRASIASDDRSDGLVLRVPTPRGSVSSTGSSRLARLLTQGVRHTPDELVADAPRRLSWERRESIGQLPRSASIDSMVEAAICARHSEPSTSTLAPPGRADRALSLVSPAVGRRAKSQRGQAEQVYTRSTLVTHTSGTPTVAAAKSAASSAAGTRGAVATPAPGMSSEPRQPAPSTSSSTMASAAETALEVPSTPGTGDLALDEDVLLLLGDAPEPETDFGKPVHKDIASRWQDILSKGLPKDVLDKLLKEYLIPKNCDLLVSPILNPEVKVALPESMAKRDAALSAKQRQIGIALAALSQVVELVINKESCTQKILKPLGDACRILCDSHFCDTRTRRGFVIAAVNADLKDAVTESKRDKFLFGSNIAEQLKSAKTIKQSGSVLKQTKNEKSQKFNKNNFIKYKNYNSNRLNWTTTPRRAPNRQDFSRPATRRPATRANFQQRDKSERSPARRSRRQ